MLRRTKRPIQKRVTRRAGSAPKRAPSRAAAAAAAPRPRPSASSGPPKPLPGMEFVVRKTKKKEVEVPHTSDFSDLYGEEYLVGIDLKCTRDMQKESAKATKEAQQIHRERKEKVDRLRREADEKIAMEKELAKKGIKSKRRASSDKDWVAVDVPIKLGKGQTVPESVIRNAAANSAPSANGKRVLSKAAQVAEQKARIEQRSRALKERILRATGGSVKKTSPSPEEERGVKRRADSPRRDVRKRPARDDRYAASDWRDERLDRPRSRRDEYERGYDSEEFSEEDEDSDDESETFGIEALEREEERSAKWAKIEDRREREREMEHKKEKERRRKEFERRNL